MRVLYSFPDTVGKPGIGWVAHHQVRHLVAQGVDVELYCTSVLPGSGIDGLASLVTTMEVGGRRIPHRALGVHRAYRRHDARVARALRSGRADADLVHTWPRAVLRTAAAAGERGVPVIREAPNTHTAHAYEVVAAEHRALGLPLESSETHAYDRDIVTLEEAEYAAADLLLVPSELAERTFIERGVEPERLALHRYGFDPDRFTPGQAGHADTDPLTVLFAARCEPRKALHHALSAWRRSGLGERGARFIICGEFVPGYREIVATDLEQRGVEFRGFSDDLDSVMREADVFVLPSVEEGSALVTYAAQGSGCVPVVSDAAGARCRHMHDGLVHHAGDVDVLAEHLRLLDGDRDLLRRLRSASIDTAATLTWENATRDLVRSYERALGSAVPA